MEEAAQILADAEAEKERILSEAEAERQALMDEALVNIDELYALNEQPTGEDWNVDDESNFDEEFDFGDELEPPVDVDPFEVLDHQDVGTIWYGVNDKYKDQISEVDESEWLVTLTNDILTYYLFGGVPGLWLFT